MAAIRRLSSRAPRLEATETIRNLERRDEIADPIAARRSADIRGCGAVGVARRNRTILFSASDSRTRRRDERAYEATKLLSEGEVPSRQGYDLVLAGRLRKLADGSVIACTIAGIDLPPDCVVSATFDRVTIEHPSTGAVLAQWGA